jgi:hypothetical protein
VRSESTWVDLHHELAELLFGVAACRPIIQTAPDLRGFTPPTTHGAYWWKSGKMRFTIGDLEV